MEELELKFSLSEAQADALGAELRRRGARAITMVAQYHDSADGLLARHGVSLRLRREGRAWRQTLKATGDSAVHRLEHDVPVRVAPGTTPALDLTRHAHSAAAAALQRAFGDAADGAPPARLVERFVTDFRRLRTQIHVDGAAVEVALDRGVVRAGARSVPLCEVEFELLSGAPAGLFALAAEWCAHGGWWLDVRSKALRGTLLADGLAHAPALKAAPTRFDDAAPDGAALARAVLRGVLDQVLANASALAAAGGDAEHVHQLRIGLRRLRTALHELAPVAPALELSVQAPLADAFARLGALRDDTAVSAAVRPLLEAAGAPLVDAPPAASDAAVDPGAVVRAPALQQALLALLAVAHGGGAVPLPPADTLRHVQRRLSKLHRQCVDAPFAALAPAAQHDVRKRLKRLRYLAEFVQPLHDGKSAARYLKRLAAAQDALGAHNDIAVGAERFRAHAARDGAAWFAAGFLQARLALTARDAEAALARVARAPRFWKKG